MNSVDPIQVQQALSSISTIRIATAEALATVTERREHQLHELLEREQEVVQAEYIVLFGIVRAFLYRANGDDVTTNFYTSHQPISPGLLRGLNGKSFFNLQVISEKASVLRFSHLGMQEKMNGYKDLEIFGHQVMMRDAAYRAEREVMLLKGTGRDKLHWFRTCFPTLENSIPHYYIASFLGMTPTSLSRIRSSETIQS